MKNFLVFLFPFLAPGLCAQNVQLIVPRQPVPLGTAFQVQYVIVNASDLIGTTTPRFENFRIASGPNRYKGSTTVNGRMQPVENITYTLVPLSTGQLKIEGMTASFRSAADQSSGDVSISVVPPPRASFNTLSSYTDVSLYAPSSTTDRRKLLEENLFIRVKVDKKTCYVGEPIMATFVLYSRLQSTSEVLNAPSLYGFSVLDMLDINEAHQSVESINGRIFNTSVLRQLQLYPEQAGKLVIDEMELHNSVEFVDSSTKERTVVEKNLSSEPVAITVKPLPSNPPGNYTGAVGKFRIASKIDGQVVAGQQGRLVITLIGKGNFIQFSPPAPEWPRGFDVFEPAVTDTINTGTSPAEGKRVYSFGFTVDSTGNYLLPPVAFSYFDTDSGHFRTIRTDSLQVQIVKPPAKEIPLRPAAATANGLAWWIWLMPVLVAAALIIIVYKKRKAPTPPAPAATEPERPSRSISLLDISSLSDKEACSALQRLMSAFPQQCPSMTAAQQQEWRSIQADCQLMVYATINEEGKKDDLKKRALQLALELESAHSAYL